MPETNILPEVTFTEAQSAFSEFWTRSDPGVIRAIDDASYTALRAVSTYFAYPPKFPAPTDEAKAAALGALQDVLFTPAKHFEYCHFATIEAALSAPTETPEEERRRVLGEIVCMLKKLRAPTGEFWRLSLRSDDRIFLHSPERMEEFDCIPDLLSALNRELAKCQEEEAEKPEKWIIRLAAKLQEQYAPIAPAGTIPGMAAVIAEEFDAQKKREGGA